MQDTDCVIKVENVNKVFKLPHEKHTSIKSAFINFYRRKRTYEVQHALRDISFEIKKGEFFGIVGRNGSGKSTLLKLLAGIYTVTKGTIQVNGELTPFIELGVGFNPELTGRENVFLNGALLGFSRKEMSKMYKDIVEFAELEKFMDQKLKNYSSGMQVRLAFSIAIRAQSDILLIDEVLAVGDLDFQRKCYNYFVNLKKRSQTVVFVTHDMSAVRRFCTRAALINDGQLVSIGNPYDIARGYENMALGLAEKRLQKENNQGKQFRRQGTKEAEIIKVETFNKQGKRQNTFRADEKIGVRLICQAQEPITAPAIGFIFQNEADITVFATNNQIIHQPTKDLKKGEKIITETIVDNVFTDGEYTITCAIESEDFSNIYDRIEYIHSFMIGGHQLSHATVHPDHSMKISYISSGNKGAR